MFVWSWLASNESHFLWKTVRSVEKEHRAGEEITTEIAETQTAKMWLAALQFQPAAVSWSTNLTMRGERDTYLVRYALEIVRRGSEFLQKPWAAWTEGFNAHPLLQKLCFWSLPLRYLFMSHQSRPILMSTRDLLLVVLSRQVPGGRSTNFLHELPHHSCLPKPTSLR